MLLDIYENLVQAALWEKLTLNQLIKLSDSKIKHYATLSVQYFTPVKMVFSDEKIILIFLLKT